jgi:hypothetical protein
MLSPDTRFSLLCGAELLVVLTGIVNLPAAVVLQILLPVVLFRDLILTHHPIPFIGVFILGTIIFAGLLVFFRHTLIPLVILGAFAALALFIFILNEARLQRQYGGEA